MLVDSKPGQRPAAPGGGTATARPRRNTAHDAAVDYLFEVSSRFQNLMSLTRISYWMDLGLTVTQVRLLAHVARDPGIRVGELAARVGMPASNLTFVIDRLEELALLERCLDAHDRRAVRLKLTSEGELALHARPSVEGLLRELLSHLSETELRMVLRSTRAFNEAALNERAARAERRQGALRD